MRHNPCNELWMWKKCEFFKAAAYIEQEGLSSLVYYQVKIDLDEVVNMWNSFVYI